MDTMYEAAKVEPVPSKKRFEQNRGDLEDWDSSRDGTSSRSGSPPPSTGKRKMYTSDREPESPTDLEPHQPTPPYAKREKSMYPRDRMETDSPSSYPRHVIVPTDEHQREGEIGGAPHPESTPSRKSHVAAATPTLTPESVSMASGGGAGYEPHYYRPPYYGSEGGYHNGSARGNPNFPAEVDMGHYGQRDNVYLRPSPKRWACDYCNVATFLSYDEACAHEEQCARRHQEHYARLNPRPPMRSFGNGSGSGLGALYHASQEVGPMPPGGRWNARAGPPMPMLPTEKNYRMQQQPHAGYGDYRGGYEMDEYQYHPHQHQHQREPEQRRGMLLSLSTDSDSLSDRQCYVRTTMVEIFAASEKDVAARHTKGAQKLAVGQVGIRCVYCSHLRPRDRAERAVCYPSSISRIYQTVADMQRFHFEQCTEIPSEVREIYKSLKTTRPRGVGSPQTYWVQSAKVLGLADSPEGIRFQEESNNNSNSENGTSNNSNAKQQSDMSL
ncbi:expressed unknown protein [Seminavis robusta]|uniref:Uncharacterized protein n=1 Tax=Seminavis robusta TaxID=568900 RepID=A0A9N8H526_9STRA|nr:expressed unknown protein [Seminavis robusta]|eukprot:Sro17_g012140.1 n/a (498) ;mRNA; r:39070-40651